MKALILVLVLLVLACSTSEPDGLVPSLPNLKGVTLAPPCRLNQTTLVLQPGYGVAFCCSGFTGPNIAFNTGFQSLYRGGHYSVTNAISSYLGIDCPPPNWRANYTLFADGIPHDFWAVWKDVPWRTYSAYLWFKCENYIDTCEIIIYGANVKDYGTK